MEWWGFSKEQGWVVLDRSIPSNAPGLGENLLFFRCRDAMTFTEKRKLWVPPLYRFAPNYIRDLAPAASLEAAAELETLKAHWPEFQRQIWEEQQAADMRTEAIRIELEAHEKALTKEKKKASRTRATAKSVAA
jgi:hypothetical protein